MFSYFLSIKEQVPTKERWVGNVASLGRKRGGSRTRNSGMIHTHHIHTGTDGWSGRCERRIRAEMGQARRCLSTQQALTSAACLQASQKQMELQHPYPLSSWPGASAVSGTGNVWSEGGIIWGWANFVVCVFLHMPVHFWWMNNQMSKKTTPVLVLTTPFEQ